MGYQYQYIFARCHTMCPRRHHCVLAWSLQCCLWSLSCLWWIFRFLVGISITLRDVTNIVLNLYEWSLGGECGKLWSCADVPVFSRTNLWHLCVFAGHKGVEAKADVFFSHTNWLDQSTWCLRLTSYTRNPQFWKGNTGGDIPRVNHSVDLVTSNLSSRRGQDPRNAVRGYTNPNCLGGFTYCNLPFKVPVSSHSLTLRLAELKRWRVPSYKNHSAIQRDKIKIHIQIRAHSNS